ncbi:MAG: glycoside hydrolase family 2 TIM barrel-domain containing protein [Flavisolibacter sp.]
MNNNLKKNSNSLSTVSRRSFVQNCTLAVLALTAESTLTSCLISKGSPGKSGRAGQKISLDQDWLFGGKFHQEMVEPGFNDSKFSPITLPHCVTNLSWQKWEPSDWQDIWAYRRHFKVPKEVKDMRVFLHFDGVMVGATPIINGHTLPQHLGGYLPFQYDITDWLKEENLLTVIVDSRWSNVPPQGSPKGTKSVDYLEPGGIHRSVWLEAVPKTFISDVFAKPVRVLEADRRIEVTCQIDSAMVSELPVALKVEMKEGKRVISHAQETVAFTKTGQAKVSVSLSNLGDVILWDTENPHLYDIEVTLLIDGKPIHDYHTRIGLREARFELDGFFLNGRRLQLFGLNRHEIYPYVGFALPDRAMRQDAEILKKDYNCNFVRCSHYPQTEAFLNACDELGLLVWEEVPGWNYLGDEEWKQLLVRDVKDMILRDRNHPSIVIWGTRANESANDIELYKKTKALAQSLDDSRPSSGSMTSTSKKGWDEDVFAFDDYHSAPDGTVGIVNPVEGVPFMLSEAVGQFNYPAGKGFTLMYRRDAEPKVQQLQALHHAQVHNRAAFNQRICGVIAWCAFEYSSLVNSFKGIKNPGVADVFRIPKLGASFYQSQGDPKLRPEIHPNFYWDFGPKSPRGPGQNVAIFSNCDRLEIYIDDVHYSTLQPDRKNFPNLKHPPFFADLDMDGKGHPLLRIDGFVTEKLVLSRSFSSDTNLDQLSILPDDTELMGDGIDAIRIVFRITDKYGAARPFVGGKVDFTVEGPGILIGDNPFDLDESGGAAAIWIKSKQNSSGYITLLANHAVFGSKTTKIKVRRVHELK